MLPGDMVPRFRRDLKIEKKPDPGGLYEVSDTKAEKHFTLYDIELSIARMLDGKRTAQQVIEAGTKIGIPITLESLEKFERQLTAYGFLEAAAAAAAAAEAPENPAWAPRTEWSPEIRELFRSALVKFRQNRLDEATEYLKAMLAVDAENEEAKDVLAAIAAKRPFAAPIVPALPAPDAAISSDAPKAEAPATASDAAVPAVAAAEAPPAPESVPFVSPAPSRPLPAWALPSGGGALALTVMLFIPFPRSVSASVVLEDPDAVVVTAPRDGVVKEMPAANGTWVDKGSVLLALDDSDGSGTLKPFDARVASLEKTLADTQRAISGKQIAGWTKTVKKLEKEVEAAKAAAARLPEKKAGAAQKKVADKERELVEARAELGDATKTDVIAKLKQQLEEATAAREAASAEERVLRAPATGVVIELATAAGQHIQSGTQLARIADSHALQVVCTVATKDAGALALGQNITATVKGHALPLNIESVDGTRAVARLTQTGTPELIVGDSGEAKIRVDAKSLLGRLIR